MRLLREAPLDAEVRAERDDEHALALLRDRRNSPRSRAVAQRDSGGPAVLAGSVVLLETAEMVHPALAGLLLDLRIAELMLDVLK